MSDKVNLLDLDPKYWHVEFQLSGSGYDLLRYGVSLDMKEINGTFEFQIQDGYTAVGRGFDADFNELGDFVEIRVGENTIPDYLSYLSLIVINQELRPLKPSDITSINPQILVPAPIPAPKQIDTYYPDTLQVLGTDIEINCRFVPARSNRLYRKQDGSEIYASYNIAFRLGTGEELKEGMVITGINRNGEIISGAFEVPLLSLTLGMMHNVGVV